MKKDTALHHFILILILAGGIGMFFYAQGNSLVQLIVGIVTSCAYVVWGILHHTMHQELHRKIVIEYILIGMLAIVLLFTIFGT